MPKSPKNKATPSPHTYFTIIGIMFNFICDFTSLFFPITKKLNNPRINNNRIQQQPKGIKS